MEAERNRLTPLFLIAAAAMTLSGCSSQSEDDTDENGVNLSKSDAAKSTVIAKSVVQYSDLPADGVLTAYLLVDGGNKQDLTISEQKNNASITFDSPATGSSQSLKVCFEYSSNVTDNNPLPLTCSTQNFTWQTEEATTDIIFETTDFESALTDTDGDGKSNVAEIVDGTNPYSCVVGLATVSKCRVGA